MKLALPLAALSLAMLSACSTTPTQEAAPAKPAEAAKPAPAAAAPAAAPAPKADPFAALKDSKNILSKRSVYFDYDKYEVKLDDISVVEAHAKFLKAQKADARAKVLIQGNTDERGSREYNLALGQKRADAVKQVLTTLGAGADQIETVSLGEEKPKATGKDEESYAQNRRADILYKGEY